MKPFLRFCLPILFCFMAMLPVYPQDSRLLHTEYSHRHYTSHDNLPDMMINCLFQDSQGYLWLGLNNGLAYYDGRTFHTVISNPEIVIYRIDETAEGRIRGFGHRGMYTVFPEKDSIGNVRLTQDTFLRPEISRNMPSGYAIYENIEDEKRALYSIEKEELSAFLHLETLNEQDQLQSPYWDRANKRIYVSSDKIDIYDEKGVLLKTIPDIAARYFVPHTEGLFVLCADGIYHLKEENIHKRYSFSFSMGTGIYGLTDRSGRLIIKDGESIYQYADGQMETIYSGITYPTDILLDREDNLWVSSFKGLYCFFKRHFKNYMLPDKDDLIRSVLVDRQNNLWAGSLNGQLIRISGNKAENVTYPVLPEGTYFHPFPAMQENKLFFNVRSILSYNDRTFTYLNVPPDRYLFTTALPDGNLASTSNRQLIIYNSNGAVIKTYSRQELQQAPRHVVTDSDGTLLVTGMYGISRIDEDSMSLISGDSLSGCFLITKDPSGTIWFNADNRLFTYKNGDIRLMQTFDNTQIRGIHITKDNIIIVSTPKGLYLSTLDFSVVKLFNHSNGFMGTASFNSNLAEDANGNVYIPTLEYMIQFNPSELIYRQPTPLLHLLTVQKSDDNIHWQKSDEGKTTFRHNEKNIRFNYIAICYSAIGNLYYQYRLKGFQEDWSLPQPTGETVFNNLKPGKYEFQLKANAGTSETETGIVSYPFEIKPAFWQTWWFIVLSVLLFSLLLAYLIYSFYKRKLQRQMEHVRREAQLNDLKVQSIRLRAIPHFNANVLNGIEYYLQYHSKEVAENYLLKYSNFMNQTLRDVNKACNSLEHELRYVELYLSLEEPQFNYPLTYDISIGEGVNTDIQLPNMVLHTYCENAVKHGLRMKRGPAHIRITAEKYPEGVKVAVEDNGIGREKAAQNTSVHSTKQGLSILMQQVELYNELNEQKIIQSITDLRDEKGEAIGTRFELYVPSLFSY